MSAFVMTVYQVCKAKKHDYWTHQYNSKVQNLGYSASLPASFWNDQSCHFLHKPKKQRGFKGGSVQNRSNPSA
jgi:hypothetical protein